MVNETEQHDVDFVIPWPDINSGKLSPEDIENIRVEALKELQERRKQKQLVVERINLIAKGIIRLEEKKRDLTTKRQKCQTNIDLLLADIEILKSKFWANKEI